MQLKMIEALEQTQLEPPALAEFLLASLTRRDHAEAVVGDLSERFVLESEALG